MAKVGLIAGGGTLPIEFILSAKNLGEKVVVFALNGMASKELEKLADRVYWLEINQYKKFLFLLLKERIRHIALVGKVPKNVVYSSSEGADEEYVKSLGGLPDRKDYSILEEVTRHLKKIGVEVVDNMRYLSHLIPEKSLLTDTQPDEMTMEDIKFGYDTAKRIAGMDIGQTVIVKHKAVVAVEAMEGTDAAIERAYDIAGEDCVMVKVSRPDQDMRWDVPTIGPDTIKLLARSKYSALAIESGKMYVVEKERVITEADAAGISIEAI
ncbi:MAG: DUF1009 domain-containing protein [Candidatus Omnitrophica bacterium]|nr:DUF1009 domain-containing protein [Candidatus Omnitrophota bacterium]